MSASSDCKACTTDRLTLGSPLRTRYLKKKARTASPALCRLLCEGSGAGEGPRTGEGDRGASCEDAWTAAVRGANGVFDRLWRIDDRGRVWVCIKANSRLAEEAVANMEDDS